jgi:catechol 2,3-dioxygenase-like lactoylglutathione lyase family enzyme
MDEFVKGLVWVGSRTEHYKEVEVFGPSDTEHTHFSTGPVVGFLVDDVESARKRLEAEGIEFIGPVHEWEPTEEAWSHFRAPDGNVYEIVRGPKR